MHWQCGNVLSTLAISDTLWQGLLYGYLGLKVLIGFSIIIFVHELGHFLAAKWMNVRVDRFAVGFFHRLVGYRRGEGLTFGRRPEYRPEDLSAKGWGETDYCLNVLPFGGYVRMLGEDDLIIDEKTGELQPSKDPRAFTSQPVGRRVVVVSAGVIFNALFALVVFAGVYLFAGREVIAPVIGAVDAGSPAAKAGLRPGDRVTAIDGERVTSFQDILVAMILAADELRFEVERDGTKLDHELVLDLGQGASRAGPGFEYPLTTTIGPVILDVPDAQGLKQGDRVVAVAGRPVESVPEILEAFELSRGQPVEFTIERADPNQPGGSQKLQLQQRPVLVASPTGEAGGDSRGGGLLGFVRRRAVSGVQRGFPGEAAGFQPGDVIARWGTVDNPSFEDIVQSAAANAGTPTSVTVVRGAEPMTLSVIPGSGTTLFGRPQPRLGLDLYGSEEARAVVADIVPGTPAAETGIPRGAQLVAIDGQRVESWFDVYEALRAAAGKRVTLRYRVAGEEASGELTVPSSIVNELDLPPTVRILTIAGQDGITLESGVRVALPATHAVHKLLEQHVGQTVTVEYVPSGLSRERRVAAFTVQPGNLDPWQMRWHYDYPLKFVFRRTLETVDARGNPLVALGMGLEQTGDVFKDVYQLLVSMLSPRGQVTMQAVSGPVGIIRHSVQQAKTGLGELLFFLAYLSVNLAIINLAPLPVVDGGLLVFLLLEKLRGRRLNFKVQMITTLAGLAVIVLCFVLVTIQDISKWWAGGI